MRYLEYNQDYFNSIFGYTNGLLYWKHDRSDSVRKGKIAGYLEKSTGYIKVKVDGTIYAVHRVIWVMLNGALDSNIQIDHRDMNRSNNLLDNLRVATPTQNKANSNAPATNTSGYKGVRYRNGKWIAEIRIDKKIVRLGTFSSGEEAFQSYKDAAIEYHGEFARFD